ncbi:SDR family NAD(P)-dependent oxidoreductase [Cytobacillus suaedae]|nr:SDR family NAD(P)-dependent oxidoreductase [Cytobacillus suaedae]
MYKNKIILVTGGTGSFGNYIVHRLLTKDVKEIRILSRDEKKQYDMRIHYKNNPKLKFFIGDIRDLDRVNEVMKDVDIVYQAAALKHVSVCEMSPFEAVKTNVIGVKNVISAAISNQVERVICVSTDKSVKPVNVMGMTKAIQERLIISANQAPENNGTIFSVVRYGNVLLSRGSVIPYFRKLLSEGEMLTITDEKMTRFLLTLEDAIDLVMFATENAVGGETFVKKAPSAYIVDLAEVLCQEGNKPFEYKVIGKLPGEKLDEILITEEELQRTEDKGDYFTIHPWWHKEIYRDILDEYSSGMDIIRGISQLKDLIAVADIRAAEVHVEKGEFSKI